jgi:hypothetical protein
MSHTANELTRSDIELLALLCEELAESTQAACKMLRHGRVGTWQGQTFDNVQDLEKELGHVRAAIGLLIERSVLDAENIIVEREHKLVSVKEFLHYQHTDHQG